MGKEIQDMKVQLCKDNNIKYVLNFINELIGAAVNNPLCYSLWIII